MTALARTVWSDFRAAGSPGDYRLVSPSLAKSDPAGAKRVEQRWKDTFGDLTLARMLEKTRTASTRRRYKPAYASEFESAGRTPVYLDDLPDVDDLARIALAPGWRPIVDMLADLDRK